MNNQKKDKGVLVVIIIIIALFCCFPLITMMFLGGVFVLVGLILFNIFNGLGVEIGVYDMPIRNFEDQLVTNYNDYKRLMKSDIKLTKEDFEKNNYYIFEVARDSCSETNFFLNGVKMSSSRNGVIDELEITLSYFESCDSCDIEYMYYAIKLDKKVKKVEDATINYEPIFDIECDYEVEINEKKPMIYIYPEEDMEVEVKLGNSNLLTTSYPKYNDGWKVFARKDGTLLSNDREYYGLYWEGKRNVPNTSKEGFVVKGEDTAKFLEEKLEILGLNEREINEFIVYWLPKMEANKYNLVRFETKEEIDEYMPLEITPTPDTVIRVYMTFKGLNKEIEVKEQELTKVTREGYTVVEWGGYSYE